MLAHKGTSQAGSERGEPSVHKKGKVNKTQVKPIGAGKKNRSAGERVKTGNETQNMTHEDRNFKITEKTTIKIQNYDTNKPTGCSKFC